MRKFLIVGLFLVSCGAEPAIEENLEESSKAKETTSTDEVIEKETWSNEEAPKVVETKELTTFEILDTDSSEDTTPTITWSESDYTVQTSLNLTDDVTYDLVIASNSTCSTAVQTYTDLTDLSQSLDTALTEGTYYACVTSKSQGEAQTATNNGLQFGIDLLPTTFTLTDVDDSTSADANTDITLTWSESTNAAYYQVTIDSTEATTNYETASATISFAGGGSSYTVFVTAYDNEGNSQKSNEVTFTVTTTYTLAGLGYQSCVNTSYPTQTTCEAAGAVWKLTGATTAQKSSHNNDIAKADTSFTENTCLGGKTTYKFSDGWLVDMGGSTYRAYTAANWATYGCDTP